MDHPTGYISYIHVQFSSDRQNEYDLSDDYDAFLFYRGLFDRADNFSVFARQDLAGGTAEGGITDITYCVQNGKKVYLSIDGGMPIPEAAITTFRTEDASEEMIREIVTAAEQFFNIKISHHQCNAVSENSYALWLYEG